MLKKKIWANFQRIVEVFTQTIFNMLSNIWVWDPRSGIRKKLIPDPDPQHCYLCLLLQGLMCDVNMPEGTNYLPIVHVYGFSKADDPAMDVKSR